MICGVLTASGDGVGLGVAFGAALGEALGDGDDMSGGGEGGGVTWKTTARMSEANTQPSYACRRLRACAAHRKVKT